MTQTEINGAIDLILFWIGLYAGGFRLKLLLTFITRWVSKFNRGSQEIVAQMSLWAGFIKSWVFIGWVGYLWWNLVLQHQGHTVTNYRCKTDMKPFCGWLNSFCLVRVKVKVFTTLLWNLADVCMQIATNNSHIKRRKFIALAYAIIEYKAYN